MINQNKIHLKSDLHQTKKAAQLSIKMSLFLTVKQVINIKIEGQSKIETKLTLVIQNSKSGALLVHRMKFNRLQWDDQYRFPTAIDQNVQFILIKGDQKQAQLRQNVIGKGKLYTKKFYKMFQSQIQQKHKQQSPFQYEITLYKQVKHQEIVTGIVKIQVQIDKNKQFQGQVISNADLDLRGQVQSNPKFVKFYLGKSSKINIFSLFDQKANDPKFRFIESIYKDIE